MWDALIIIIGSGVCIFFLINTFMQANQGHVICLCLLFVVFLVDFFFIFFFYQVHFGCAAL